MAVVLSARREAHRMQASPRHEPVSLENTTERPGLFTGGGQRLLQANPKAKAKVHAALHVE